MTDTTASIVAYNSEPGMIRAAMAGALAAAGTSMLYLVDNSPGQGLSAVCEDGRADYVHTGANLGYGRAHNVAIRRAVAEGAAYHMILNPDIYFDPTVPATLHAFMDAHPDVGMVMPQVRSPEGDVQYLCKRDPRPMDLIGRRFLPGPLKRLVAGRLARYERRDIDQAGPSDVDVVSGCFMFARTGVLDTIGGFDERYFLYLEDYDLCREVRRAGYRVVYLPTVHVFHHHGRASYRRLRPLMLHITSAIRYFNKWGWWPLW